MCFKYKKNSKTKITLTAYEGTEDVVIVPETIDNLRVTKIDYMCFFDNDNITKIVFPSNITIENSAIVNCKNLENVKLNRATNFTGFFIEDCGKVTISSDSNTQTSKLLKTFKSTEEFNDLTIDNPYIIIYRQTDRGLYVTGFYESINCTDVEIPDYISGVKVVGIDTGVFSSTKITSLKLNKFIDRLPYHCVAYCPKLTKIYNLENIETMGSNVFYNSPKVDIDFEEMKSLKFIDTSALAGSNITKFKVINPYIILNNGAFQESNLIEADLSEWKGSTLNSNMFYHCHSLQKVIVNNSLKEIQYEAFKKCQKLKEIENANFTIIGESAFDECKNLHLDLDFAKVKEIGKFSFRNCYGPQIIVLTDAQLSKYSFANLKGTSKVIFKGSISRLPSRCFKESSVKEVHLNENIKVIDIECFYFSELKLINLENVEIIEYRAFNGTFISDIKLIDIKRFGQEVFFKCNSLRKIDLSKSSLSVLPNIFSVSIVTKKFKLPETLTQVSKKFINKFPEVEKTFSSKITYFD